MSGEMTPNPEFPPSTRDEGRKAWGQHLHFRDCPYIRGEDRWAWEQGWMEAENKFRQSPDA